MEPAIANILETVNEKLPSQIRLSERKKTAPLAVPSIDITYGETTIEIAIEFKKEPRMVHMPVFTAAKDEKGELLVIGKYMSNNVRVLMRKAGINYIDAAVNVYLNLSPLYIYIDGQKAELKEPVEKNRAFTKAGVKLIFALLEDPELLNRPYRTISSEAGVALNTINKVLAGLKLAGFVATGANKRLYLNNKKALFERWVQEFETRLKPDLVLGKFKFAKAEDFNNWKHLKINAPHSQWGGEPGGDLLTNFLRPEVLTIYTEENKTGVMKQLKLLPDPSGNVILCSKFWSNNTNAPYVPEILVYADLISHGDSRNLEVAQRIYGQYLQDRFS